MLNNNKSNPPNEERPSSQNNLLNLLDSEVTNKNEAQNG